MSLRCVGLTNCGVSHYINGRFDAPRFDNRARRPSFEKRIFGDFTSPDSLPKIHIPIADRIQGLELVSTHFFTSKGGALTRYPKRLKLALQQMMPTQQATLETPYKGSQPIQPSFYGFTTASYMDLGLRSRVSEIRRETCSASA